MHSFKSTVCIVLAAGTSSRFGKKFDVPSKVLLKLCDGRTVLEHSLYNFLNAGVDKFVLVVNDKIENAVHEIVDHLDRMNIMIVRGGDTRFHSVVNALDAISKDDHYYSLETIIIHDGARPNCSPEEIMSALQTFHLHSYDGLVFGYPCTNTIKKVSGEDVIEKTFDRNELFEVQTPQIFKKKVFQYAVSSFLTSSNLSSDHVFDDSMLLELIGLTSKIFRSSKTNIKITTPEDLVMLNTLLLADTENNK